MEVQMEKFDRNIWPKGHNLIIWPPIPRLKPRAIHMAPYPPAKAEGNSSGNCPPG